MNRRAMALMVSMLAILTGCTLTGCTPPGPVRGQATAAPPSRLLFDYIDRPDESFGWREHARHEQAGAEIVELRLTSQTWRESVWKHQLFLIRPGNVDDSGTALLVIGGGRWSDALENESAPTELPDGAEVFIGLAEAARSVVAVLGTVPFQPLLGLTEDDLIAHTFARFLDDGEPDWPLLFPMVKAGVRAMDAVQAATGQIWDLGIDSFTVTGGSKRGWTAWLTAAADRRVAAVAPIVIDALNMAEHFPYQTRVWGSPSPSISPYTALGLDQVLASAGGAALREAVDPYAYRSVLRQPKLVINATNDSYFPLDSVNLYWNGLPAPKHLLYVPNERHSIEALGLVLPTVVALHRAGTEGTDLPALGWTHDVDEDSYSLCVSSTPQAAGVVIWTARSDDRDFRDASWHPERSAGPNDTHAWTLARPDEGYAAAFAELRFAGEPPYALTTSPAVIPPRGQPPLAPGPVDNGGTCAGR